MVDFQESSQINLWTYSEPEHLSWLRRKANHTARTQLAAAGNPAELDQGSAVRPDPTQAQFFARGWTQRFRQGQEKAQDYTDLHNQGPMENTKGKAFLTAEEEETLVNFYAPKLETLIGPTAAVRRLQRKSKVTATAVLLYRRFFLSNSVMWYDPKAIMVAAAFLASKVEDATADVRNLEEGTQVLGSHVSQSEILVAELALIQGIAFDLLCFHPNKAVLALTQDLRTFLKSDKGKALVQGRPVVSSHDLKPFHDQAVHTLKEAILNTDLALLYTPGQIGLAALMVAQDVLLDNKTTTLIIDWHGYFQHRFEASSTKEATWQALQELRDILKQPTPKLDVTVLKGIHKKLKKVRAWGNEGKKRKKEDENGGDSNDASNSSKRIKREDKNVRIKTE